MKEKLNTIWQKIATGILGSLRGLWESLKRATKRKRRLSLKIVLVIIIFVVLIIFVYGIGIYRYHWSRYGAGTIVKIVPYPAGYVGGNLITMGEFQKHKDYVLRFYQETQAPPPEEAELDRQIMEQLIEQRLIRRALQKEHIFVSKNEVDAEYQQIVEKSQGEENVKKMLADLYGMNIESFKKLIGEKLVIEKFKNELLVSVHAYHILLKVPDVNNEGGKKHVGDRMWEILNQAKAGVNFQEIAQKYSQDEATKDKGGNLGWLFRGGIINDQQMSEAIEQAVFAVGVGQFSDGPVWTEFGWHIFAVTEKRGKIDQSYQKWISEEKTRTRIIKFIGK